MELRLELGMVEKTEIQMETQTETPKETRWGIPRGIQREQLFSERLKQHHEIE